MRGFIEPSLSPLHGSIDMTANASNCHPGESSKDLTRLPQLVEPLLQFDFLEELRHLRHEDSWRRRTGRVSIHALRGRICIHLPDQKVNSVVGQLLVLDCGMVHNVEALEESAFLLTVSWPKARLEP